MADLCEICFCEICGHEFDSNRKRGRASSSSSSSSSSDCRTCRSITDVRGQHPDANTRPEEYASDVGEFPDIVASVKKTDGDGHCLFRALGGYPNGGQGWSRTMQLRKQIARFQHDNPTMEVYGTAETNSTFQQYIYEEKDAALDDYTFLMTNSAVYGGAFEIGAFSKIFGKRVIVYVQNGKNGLHGW